MKAARQQGISLLEVLLVLVVAAVILSVAVIYFSQTLGYSHVSQAVNSIRQINKAGNEWLQLPGPGGQYHPDYATPAPPLLPLVPNNGNGLKTLVDAQLLSCPNNSCYKNPWGGDTILTVDSSNPQYMVLKLYGIPTADCIQLQERMKSIAPVNSNLSQQNVCIADSTSKNITYQVYL